MVNSAVLDTVACVKQLTKTAQLRNGAQTVIDIQITR